MTGWTYAQATGDLDHGPTYEGRGYSGHGPGVNKPALQNIVRVGPIPQGKWVIGAPRTDPHLGPLAFPLSPAPGTNAFGRSGFFIHGDNSLMNETGSEGCIVLGRAIREVIAAAVASGDNTLEVVA